MNSVCVYCGSSSQVSPVYLDTASKLGKILAENNIELIYGGGSIGLMGAIAESVLNAGGRVTGIIPRFMYDENWFKAGLTELLIVDTMHERKQKMAQAADALVALPGGCGTLEELLEVITWKQLGLITKPIIIADIDSYYAPLLKMLEQAVERKFMRDQHLSMWQVAHSPEEILPAIKSSMKCDINYRKFAAM